MRGIYIRINLELDRDMHEEVLGSVVALGVNGGENIEYRGVRGG